jgi:hypothetical protein
MNWSDFPVTGMSIPYFSAHTTSTNLERRYGLKTGIGRLAAHFHPNRTALKLY